MTVVAIAHRPHRAATAMLVAAVLAVAGAVVLFGLRFASAISFSEAIQLTTSGSEEESIFVIWNFLHGGAIYLNRLEIPFAATAYNWLFYVSYALVAKAALTAFALGDEWLPTVTRLTTFAGAVWLGFIAFLTARVVMPPRNIAENLLAATIAGYVAFGPLNGYWDITTRPDVWAIALEVTGTFVFLRWMNSRRLGYLLAVGAIAFLAWSFKQTAVGFLCAVGGGLLLRGRWRDLAALVIGMAIAFGGTMLIGGERYTKAVLVIGWNPDADLAHALWIVGNVVTKTMPGFAAALGGVVWIVAGRRVRYAWRDDRILFGALAVLSGLVMNASLATHPGAAENYYFWLHWGVVVFAMATLRMTRDDDARGTATVVPLAWIAGWVALFVAVGVVILGYHGTRGLRPMHRYYMDSKACLDQLPRPLYVNRPYLSLPWMTPGSTPFVVSWYYYFDRRNGQPFEDGGIRGLVAAGKLATVVVTRVMKTEAIDGLDADSLPGYTRVEPPKCDGFKVFVRKKNGNGGSGSWR